MEKLLNTLYEQDLSVLTRAEHVHTDSTAKPLFRHVNPSKSQDNFPS
jgi:hypothetical protein